MANTYTTTYNLIKPEVGADTNAWGTHLNTDLDTIDSNMLSRALTSAQTMAGALNLPSNGLNVGSGQLQVSGGNVSLSGQLATTGAATFSNTLRAYGVVTFDNNLAVAGVSAFAGNATFSGTTTVQTPASSGHATTKAYVDSADALKLNLTGGTLTGNLSIINSTTEMTFTLGSSGGYYFGNATLAGFKNSGGTARVSWNISTGDFTAAGNVTAYSDARLKQNIKTIENAVDLVNKMRGVYYDRIDTGETGVGVIAQEMRDVVPEVVVENDGTLSVAYGNLVGVLIEAVKELSAKVAALEAR